jgi:hypothetical protein
MNYHKKWIVWLASLVCTVNMVGMLSEKKALQRIENKVKVIQENVDAVSARYKDLIDLKNVFDISSEFDKDKAAEALYSLSQTNYDDDHGNYFFHGPLYVRSDFPLFHFCDQDPQYISAAERIITALNQWESELHHVKMNIPTCCYPLSGLANNIDQCRQALKLTHDQLKDSALYYSEKAAYEKYLKTVYRDMREVYKRNPGY